MSSDFTFPSPQSSYSDSRSDEDTDFPRGSNSDEDRVLFVDKLANTYGLGDSYRDELHSFLQLAWLLPQVQLTVALIQQATTLQTQQYIRQLIDTCTTFKGSTDGLKSALMQAPQSMKDHTSVLNAACKLKMFDGLRIDFDNDAIKSDVLLYLKQRQDSNGLTGFFEEGSPRNKLLKQSLGRSASYAKSSVRQHIIDSMVKNPTDLTALTSLLARKCIGSADNAKPQHAIWCAIIRAVLRDNPELLKDIDKETRAAALKRKRNAPDTENNDTNATEEKKANDFWGRVSTFWNKKNAEWGPDLKSAGWMQHINKIITEERALYPNDPLPLIPLLATPTPPPVRRPTSDPLQEVTINGSVRTTTGLAALSNYRDDQRQPSGLTATGYSAHHRSSSEMYTVERTHHRNTAPSDQAPGPPLRLPPSSSVSSSGGYDENSRGMHASWRARGRAIAMRNHLNQGLFVAIGTDRNHLRVHQIICKNKSLSHFSFTRQEAEGEAALLRAAGATLPPDLGPAKNPWGSINFHPAPMKLYGFHTAGLR
ncbi:hypothetical protein C8J57DRAFT_1258028 [Mycena rebaudengoi]|nr:hypothetical protein C8J57DRAFT_1258028 [Mycena rebaudengoi]